MTQPPPGWPSGQPQDPQHPGWQQPPSAPGGWPVPQPGGWQQAPQQPGGWQQAPQQPGAPGAWPQQPPADQAWGAPQAAQPPRSHNRGRLIASAAVVIALAAGGVVTYAAVSDTNSAGASSPQQAVRSVLTDLNESDLVGVLDDLAPGERDALINPTLDEIHQLKRLRVLREGADPTNVSGVTFDAKDLTFADTTLTINDHIQIVQVTGGTLDIGADASKVPFTKDFIDSAFPDGLPQRNGSTHIDIAKAVRDQGNGPVRIATQKVGGRWYPSIFYTIADQAAAKAVPSASDAIPAAGASSPQDAVTKMVNALLQADLTGAIRLLSPDELAVMHDYGGLFLRKASSYQRPDATVKDLQLTTTKVSGGATRVLLSGITVVSGNGDQTTVRVDGNCVEVTAQGQQKRMCTTDFVTQILNSVNGFGVSLEVTPAQRQAFEDLLGGLTKVGVDTTQSGGQWYVNPVRSWLEVTTSVLSGLKDNDLLELLSFFSNLGSH